MDFDLTDLRLFVRAAEEGNLTRAAARQHLSLPAASARIKALEARAGLPLFQRQARGMRTTPAGDAFLHHARQVLRQSQQLREDLRAYGTGLHGHLRVQANTTAVSDILPGLLPAFLAAHPKVDIDLQERPNAFIPQGVRDAQADIGIVAGAVDTQGLEAIHFSTDRLVLVTARDHRLAGRGRISFAETLDEDAVGMLPGSTLQAFLGRIVEDLGRTLRLRIQLGSFDAMCRMIGSGVGVGVVPESAALRNREAMGLALVELADAWCVRERYLLVRDRAALPSYAQALVDVVCGDRGASPR